MLLPTGITRFGKPVSVIMTYCPQFPQRIKNKHSEKQTSHLVIKVYLHIPLPDCHIPFISPWLLSTLHNNFPDWMWWFLLFLIVFSRWSPVLMWMVFSSAACIVSLNSHCPWISRFIVDTAPVVSSPSYRLMVVSRWRFREILVTISKKAILMMILSIRIYKLQSDTNEHLCVNTSTLIFLCIKHITETQWGGHTYLFACFISKFQQNSMNLDPGINNKIVVVSCHASVPY